MAAHPPLSWWQRASEPFLLPPSPEGVSKAITDPTLYRAPALDSWWLQPSEPVLMPAHFNRLIAGRFVAEPADFPSTDTVETAPLTYTQHTRIPVAVAY